MDIADANENLLPPDEVPLHHGDELVGLEANIVAGARPTRIIAVAGDVGAGKTTLLTSIYERFQRGMFGGFCFAGSLTLLGFERKCHASRIASGRSAPDTDRTRRGEQTAYLHLRLARERTEYDVLFTDVSGEDFQAAKDSVEDARRLNVLTRADHLLLLVDSARLIDRSLRFEASHNALTLLRSLQEAGMIGAKSAIDVLLSKFDLVPPTTSQAEHRFIRNFTEQLTGIGLTAYREFRVARIAARPTPGDYRFLDDIGELLQHWVTSSPTTQHSPHYTPPINELQACYDRFVLTARADV